MFQTVEYRWRTKEPKRRTAGWANVKKIQRNLRLVNVEKGKESCFIICSYKSVFTLPFFPPQHKISTSIWPGMNVSPIISVSAIVLVKKNSWTVMLLERNSIPVIWFVLEKFTYHWFFVGWSDTWLMRSLTQYLCQYTLLCCAVYVVFQQWIENCSETQPQLSQKVMSVPQWCPPCSRLCLRKNHNTFVVTDNKEEDPSDYALCVHSACRLSISSL